MKQSSRPANSLEADADALYLATIQAVEQGREADHDIADVINRHGFDRLIAYLTGRVVCGLALVTRCRDSEATVVFEDLLGQLDRDQPPEISDQLSGISDQFRQWILDGHRPQISDSAGQEPFVLYLLGLHFMIACELVSGRSPDGRPHHKRYRLSDQPPDASQTCEDSTATPRLTEAEDCQKTVRAAIERTGHQIGDAAE